MPNTRDLLITHYKEYPNMQITDLFKFIHQSAFGCEHMVSSLDFAINSIDKERKDLNRSENSITPLDGEYSRVHLTAENCGLSSQTFGKLFVKSAKEETDGITSLKEKLSVAKKLISDGELDFSPDEFNLMVKKWESNGFSPVHHSKSFRNEYKPSYRVIENKYIPFIPLFSRLDNMDYSKMRIVAIEGGSASGKTSLGDILETLYDCTVIHMDDFFLRPEQRTKKRYEEIGGNIDRERFLEEVLIPLSKQESFNYRKFDCSTFTLTEPVKVDPKRLVIIEGAYSMHPEFVGYYDFSVFLDISQSLQKKRIKKRNSFEIAQRFYNEWIPLEQRYFEETTIKERCDMTIIPV